MIHTSVGIPRCTAIRTCASGWSHCSAVPVLWFCCAAEDGGFCKTSGIKALGEVCYAQSQSQNAIWFISKHENFDSWTCRFKAANLHFGIVKPKLKACSVFQDHQGQTGLTLVFSPSLCSHSSPPPLTSSNLCFPFRSCQRKKKKKTGCIYRRLFLLRQTLVTPLNAACHFVMPPFEAHWKKMASTAANLYYKPDKHAAFFAVKPWLITGGDKEENHGVLKKILRNILARVCVNKCH